MSYKNLSIYTIALSLFYEVHPFTLKQPKYELYELGSQLRRSSDSVVTNIVEGYGRRGYKADYIWFLIYAHSSIDEILNHFEKISYLYPNQKEKGEKLYVEYNKLGGKLNNYIKYVRSNWRTWGKRFVHPTPISNKN